MAEASPTTPRAEESATASEDLTQSLRVFAAHSARERGLDVSPGFTGGVSAANGAAPATAAAPAAAPDAGSSPQPASDATPPQTAEPSEPGQVPPGTVRYIRKLKSQKHELKEQLAAREAELADLRSKMSTNGQNKQGTENPPAVPAAPTPAQPQLPPAEDPALDQRDEQLDQLMAERRVARALNLPLGAQLDAVTKIHRDHELDPKDALAVAQGRFPDLFPKEGGSAGAGFAAAAPMQPKGLSPSREPPKPVDPREQLRQRADDPRLSDLDRARANVDYLHSIIHPVVAASLNPQAAARR